MGLFVTSFLLLIFAVVKSQADCAIEAGKCGASIAGLSGEGGQPSAEQIQQMCPNIATFKTCIDALEATCGSDATYIAMKGSAATFSSMCSGSGGGCAVMECLAIMSGGSGGEPSDPNAEPEPQDGMAMVMQVCPKFESFKTCVAQKSQGCGPQMMAQVQNITNMQKGFCEGDCAPKMVIECVKNLDMEALGRIKGLPTKDQIEPICSMAKPAMKCLATYFGKCAVSKNKEIKDIKKQMKMTQKLLTVFCKDALPVITESGDCMNNKTLLMSMDKCVTPPAADPNQVKAESQEEMCGRLDKEKMCIKDTVVDYCNEKAATDISNLFVKVMSVMSDKEYDCSGATSGFKINLWISMFMAAVLLTFLM